MSSKLELTKARTEAVREEVATALLSKEAVMEAIGLAAGRGLARVVITSPNYPIKLKHTAAALGTAAWLEKIGFRPRWVDDRRHGVNDIGDALEVEW